MKLSIQRALLGYITPNIRAITVESAGQEISLSFYYDGDLTESDEENVSFIETEVVADFDESFAIASVVKRIDHPQRIKSSDGMLVYLRKE